MVVLIQIQTCPPLSAKDSLRSTGNERYRYHGWMTLQRSPMHEDGLGNVMSGLATTPAAPEEDATQVQRAQ